MTHVRTLAQSSNLNENKDKQLMCYHIHMTSDVTRTVVVTFTVLVKSHHLLADMSFMFSSWLLLERKYSKYYNPSCVDIIWRSKLLPDLVFQSPSLSEPWLKARLPSPTFLLSRSSLPCRSRWLRQGRKVWRSLCSKFSRASPKCSNSRPGHHPSLYAERPMLVSSASLADFAAWEESWRDYAVCQRLSSLGRATCVSVVRQAFDEDTQRFSAGGHHPHHKHRQLHRYYRSCQTLIVAKEIRCSTV